MTRYYFHIWDGASALDADGTELPGIEDARIQAVQLSGEILRHQGAEFWRSSSEWRVDVTDDAGAIVFSLRLLAEEPLGQGAAPGREAAG